MGVIYKATNKVNGKVYIGFDSNWPRRKKKHEQQAKNGNFKQYFHHALNKYGLDSFEWSVIKENAVLEDEILLIREHETFYETGKGYNLTMGGEGKLGYTISEETRKKMSESAKKRKVTPERLAILHKNAQKMRESGHTEETKRKISEAHKGKNKSQDHRKALSDNHASKNVNGVFYQSQEYKEKMSKALKGKKRTQEQIDRIRQGALNRKNKQ